jgi:hypothetical protein
MPEQSLSSVSRETRENSLSSSPAAADAAAADAAATDAAAVDRRRLPHALVERNGRMQRKGAAWTEAELAQLRLLVDAGCATKDIAGHFQATTAAIAMTMHRHGIKRPRPRVADVLREQAPPPESSTPAICDTAVALVDLLDRFQKYECRVEFHELDPRGNCRVKRATGPLDRPGAAGQWLTVPLYRLAFGPGVDRPLAIELAKRRHAATIERRAALRSDSPSPSPRA